MLSAADVVARFPGRVGVPHLGYAIRVDLPARMFVPRSARRAATRGSRSCPRPFSAACVAPRLSLVMRFAHRATGLRARVAVPGGAPREVFARLPCLGPRVDVRFGPVGSSPPSCSVRALDRFSLSTSARSCSKSAPACHSGGASRVGRPWFSVRQSRVLPHLLVDQRCNPPRFLREHLVLPAPVFGGLPRLLPGSGAPVRQNRAVFAPTILWTRAHTRVRDRVLLGVCRWPALRIRTVMRFGAVCRESRTAYLDRFLLPVDARHERDFHRGVPLAAPARACASDVFGPERLIASVFGPPSSAFLYPGQWHPGLLPQRVRVDLVLARSTPLVPLDRVAPPVVLALDRATAPRTFVPLLGTRQRSVASTPLPTRDGVELCVPVPRIRAVPRRVLTAQSRPSRTLRQLCWRG